MWRLKTLIRYKKFSTSNIIQSKKLFHFHAVTMGNSKLSTVSVVLGYNHPGRGQFKRENLAVRPKTFVSIGSTPGFTHLIYLIKLLNYDL